MLKFYFFFFSSRRRHTRLQGDWSSDVCSSDLLELPYASGELVMDVVLPAERDGLPEIERQFAGGGLRGWLDVLKTARVDVTLPRFKTSSSFELAEAIGRLGMAKAFRYRNADFSGMDGTRELFISAGAHQALG